MVKCFECPNEVEEGSQKTNEIRKPICDECSKKVHAFLDALIKEKNEGGQNE